MQSSARENSLNDLPPVKNPVGRPRTAIYRHKQDGSYDKKPLSETYFNDYYITH